MINTVDREFVLRTLGGLVSINSVNPSLVAQAPGEAAVAAFVARAAGDLGLETAKHEPEPGRVSVVATRRGTGGGRSLMLNAHIDTVGVDGMQQPFLPEIRDGRLYGRGAYDMKGSLAACLGAVKALNDAGVKLAGDLLIAAVADEEYASLGTADLIGRYTVDGAIVTEPTQLKLCLAHKGFSWFEVVTRGRAAHGSQVEQGIDANLRMGKFLGRLADLERRLRSSTGHPLLGPPSLHAATLRGGTGLSTYAESCTLRIERRTIPGESAERVEAQIRELIERLEATDPSFRASFETLLVREPFEAVADGAVVRSLTAAATPVLGRPPESVGENPWMDSALLASAGVDTVVFGPTGGGAHAHEEWVDIDSVMKTAAVLAGAAVSYCGMS